MRRYCILIALLLTLAMITSCSSEEPPATPSPTPSASPSPSPASSPTPTPSPTPPPPTPTPLPKVELPSDAKNAYAQLLPFTQKMYPSLDGERHILHYRGLEPISNPELRSLYIFDLYSQTPEDYVRLATYAREYGTWIFYEYRGGQYNPISLTGSAGGSGRPSDDDGHSTLSFMDGKLLDFTFRIPNDANIQTVETGVNVLGDGWVAMIRNGGESFDASTPDLQLEYELASQTGDPLSEFGVRWSENARDTIECSGLEWMRRGFSGTYNGSSFSGYFCYVNAFGSNYCMIYGKLGDSGPGGTAEDFARSVEISEK